jgi:hypothetical protein
MSDNNPSPGEVLQSIGCAITIFVFFLIPLAVVLLLLGPVGWAILAAIGTLVVLALMGGGSR